MKHKIDVSILGKSEKGRYRLKVSVHDLGIHVMGMVVQDSIIEGEAYYVTTPAHKVSTKYYKDITFETESELWKEIRDACIKAVESQGDKPPSSSPPPDPLERLWK
jgi:DNA-binding cell septation regulator SpoVG